VIALTACVEPTPAAADALSVAPNIGIDLGSSARVPHVAGLAGEGEGYGRTEPNPNPTPNNSMPGMSHGSMGDMQMDHGSMPGMTHGSTGGMQMDHGAMPATGDASMGGMQMDHGSMTGMRHGSTGGMQMDHGTMPGMSHGSMGGMQMGHGSMPGMSHGSMSGMQMAHGAMPKMRHRSTGNMQMAHSGHTHAQGTGTVNSVDAATHKVNVSHSPIPTIGLPAMTMDFAVSPSVDLRAVKPGTRINFGIEQGEGGMYVIQSFTPAGGGR
jgi:Cu/Ag efflux protein CusF/uncharacterized protein involved in copper resistance